METTANLTSGGRNFTGPPATLAAVYYLHIFNEIFLPTICLTGFLGNFMALTLIQTNSTLKRMHSNVFLSFLAVCSTIFLATLFIMWIEPYTAHKIFNSSLIGCKIITFLAHWSDFCCVWLIAAVALDRAAMLTYTEKRERFYRACSAERLTGCSVTVIALGHLWLIPIATNVDLGTGLECMSDPAHHHIYKWFTILETVFAVVAPLVLIAGSNCVTAWQLRVYKSRDGFQEPKVRFSQMDSEGNIEIENFLNKSHTSSETAKASPDTRRTALSRLSTRFSLFFSAGTSSSNYAPSGSQKRKIPRPKDLNLAKTLLLVTSLFVVLNVPSYMCRLFLPALPQAIWQAYVWFFSYVMYYCHHTLLSYLYIFNSRQMRKQLKPTALKLLECYCFKTVPDFGH